MSNRTDFLHIQIHYLDNLIHKTIRKAYVRVKVAMDLHHGLEAVALSFPESDSMAGKPEADTTDPRQPERNWGDS